MNTQSLPQLPPVNASKVNAVHISYLSRSMETRNLLQPTATPTYFTKSINALNGHCRQILKRVDCAYLNCEAEYVVVISKPCRNITLDEAWNFIGGFCPALNMHLQDLRDTGRCLRI